LTKFLGYQIVLSQNPGRAEAVIAVELAGFLGFQSLCLEFPIVSLTPQVGENRFVIAITKLMRLALKASPLV
jgi:hypothetical protein